MGSRRCLLELLGGATGGQCCLCGKLGKISERSRMRSSEFVESLAQVELRRRERWQILESFHAAIIGKLPLFGGESRELGRGVCRFPRLAEKLLERRRNVAVRGSGVRRRRVFQRGERGLFESGRVFFNQPGKLTTGVSESEQCLALRSDRSGEVAFAECGLGITQNAPSGIHGGCERFELLSAEPVPECHLKMLRSGGDAVLFSAEGFHPLDLFRIAGVGETVRVPDHFLLLVDEAGELFELLVGGIGECVELVAGRNDLDKVSGRFVSCFVTGDRDRVVADDIPLGETKLVGQEDRLKYGVARIVEIGQGVDRHGFEIDGRRPEDIDQGPVGGGLDQEWNLFVAGDAEVTTWPADPYFAPRFARNIPGKRRGWVIEWDFGDRKPGVEFATRFVGCYLVGKQPQRLKVGVEPAREQDQQRGDGNLKPGRPPRKRTPIREPRDDLGGLGFDGVAIHGRRDRLRVSIEFEQRVETVQQRALIALDGGRQPWSIKLPIDRMDQDANPDEASSEHGRDDGDVDESRSRCPAGKHESSDYQRNQHGG